MAVLSAAGAKDMGIPAIGSEAELAAVSHALAGARAPHTKAERALIKTSPKVTPDLVNACRKMILAGSDVLGEAFCRLRSPATRRQDGATYTPPVIVKAMVEWAASQPVTPARIVDPGAGSGRFLMAAASKFPQAALIAVETDPLAALTLRANATVLGFSDQLTVMVADYRTVTLPTLNAPTLFIGNPPYVRHHDIPTAWKQWFGNTAATLGFRASKLAGLHIHFFLKTRQIAQPGDFGAYITAAEWLDVNYGGILRDMLANGLGGTALHVLDPTTRPFSDALTTGAITCFHVGQRSKGMTIRHIASLDTLRLEEKGKTVSWATFESAPKWSIFTRQGKRPAAGETEIGELFRVHRGQVSGANAVWIAGEHAAEIPRRFLFPSITRARELIQAGDMLESARHLRRVIDLPIDLDELTASERRHIEKFLAWAKRQGTADGYIARTRKAWWSVGLKDPAPILCTYMARRAPAFVRNICGARHLNIAHGLYPRQPMDNTTLDAVCHFLRANARTDGGRIYAGGLVKFEPKEVERLHLPRLEQLEMVTA